MTGISSPQTNGSKKGNRSASREYAFKGNFPPIERMVTRRDETNDNLVFQIALCASAKDGFCPLEMTWGFFSRIYMHHVERDTKDGLAVIFADIRELRKDAYVQSVSALAFEIDGKLSLDDVKSRVAASGKEALVWTTHNHLQTSQKVGLATYNKWQARRCRTADG